MLNVKQTHEDPADVLDEVRFAENREPRCPCVLLIDTSDSMKGDSIAQVNKGFAELLSTLNSDDLASLRVELGVITFGGTPKVVQALDSVDRIELQEFSVSGNTPMGEAIRQGFAMLDECKAMYKANGVPYYRPWMFLLTDGQPTDEWKKAAAHGARTGKRQARGLLCRWRRQRQYGDSQEDQRTRTSAAQRWEVRGDVPVALGKPVQRRRLQSWG